VGRCRQTHGTERYARPFHQRWGGRDMKAGDISEQAAQGRRALRRGRRTRLRAAFRRPSRAPVDLESGWWWGAWVVHAVLLTNTALMRQKSACFPSPIRPSGQMELRLGGRRSRARAPVPWITGRIGAHEVPPPVQAFWTWQIRFAWSGYLLLGRPGPTHRCPGPRPRSGRELLAKVGDDEDRPAPR